MRNETAAVTIGRKVKSVQKPTLYIVATPIGTLSDFSPRARETLSQVEFIACEDTRRTKELLQALQLPHVPLVSLHAHNEAEKSDHLIERLMQSEKQTAALVTDAGTPAISDPGALFVDACHQAEIRVENVPGPSSLVAAVAATGFLQPRILFSGFLPRTGKEQIREFERWLAVSPCIAVCFESPNRVEATLKNAATFFPRQMRVCLSREISKKFEEHLRMSLHELNERIAAGQLIKGECIISFEIASETAAGLAPAKETLDDVVELAMRELEENPELKLKDLARRFAEKSSLNSKDLYNAILARRRS